MPWKLNLTAWKCLKSAWKGLPRCSNLKRRYLKNGNSDLKNLTTLQIANLILYNFYFMQIYIFRTPKALKMQKTKTTQWRREWQAIKRPKGNRPRNDSEARLMFQSEANYILGKVKKLHCSISNRSGYSTDSEKNLWGASEAPPVWNRVKGLYRFPQKQNCKEAFAKRGI